MRLTFLGSVPIDRKSIRRVQHQVKVIIKDCFSGGPDRNPRGGDRPVSSEPWTRRPRCCGKVNQAKKPLKERACACDNYHVPNNGHSTIFMAAKLIDWFMLVTWFPCSFCDKQNKGLMESWVGQSIRLWPLIKSSNASQFDNMTTQNITCYKWVFLPTGLLILFRRIFLRSKIWL